MCKSESNPPPPNRLLHMLTNRRPKTSVLTATKVLKAAKLLSIPIYVTTQNRARLGDTIPELRAHLPASLVREDVDKTLFSMWTPAISRHFPRPGPSGPCSTIVIVGIESHICVTQTALDCLAAGHRVYVLADGVSSCNREEVAVALARLRAEGAVVATSEGWLYERLGDAAAPEFRGAVALVKESAADTRAALQGLLASKM